MNEVVECGFVEGVIFLIIGKNGFLCVINFGGFVVEMDMDVLFVLNLIGMFLYYVVYILVCLWIVEEEGFLKIMFCEWECL